MKKHDFRRIVQATNTMAILMMAAGCTNAGLKAGRADTARHDPVLSTESSSGAAGNDAGGVASMATPTLTELKHFAVYQRFHGLLNASAGQQLGAQSSGGSGAPADRSEVGQPSRAMDVYSCPPLIAPDAAPGK